MTRSLSLPKVTFHRKWEHHDPRLQRQHARRDFRRVFGRHRQDQVSCGEARIETRHVGDNASQTRDVEKRGEVDEEDGCVDVENDVGSLERAAHELERGVRDGSV